MKHWNDFVQHIFNSEALKNKMNKHENYLGKIKIKFREGVILLKPLDIIWKYEDIIHIEDNDPDYAIFRKLIKKFFRKKEDDSFKFI